MSVMNILRSRNAIDRITLPELREEEVRLKHHINRIRKSIQEAEADKKRLFSAGVGADMITKKMLVLDLKRCDVAIRTKFEEFDQSFKKLTFISNLVTVKTYQRELQNTEVWQKIQRLSPDELEKIFIHLNLSESSFSSALDKLNQVFEDGVPAYENVVDPEEKKMFDAWNKVEAGSLDITEAEAGVFLSPEPDMAEPLTEGK